MFRRGSLEGEPGGPGPLFMTPGDMVAQLYP